MKFKNGMKRIASQDQNVYLIQFQGQMLSFETICDTIRSITHIKYKTIFNM